MGMTLALAESALFSTALCGALCYLAYREQVLTLDGTIAAFFVGLVIGILGDVTWLLLLLFFLLSSFIATRYKFALKEAMGVQEGKKGERRASNVLANGIAPMAAAVLTFAAPGLLPRSASGVVFLSALAVAGSDTLASEIGVLSPHAVLITTFRRVTPGTDGGISALGQLCALLAAVYTALFGWLVLGLFAQSYTLDPTVPVDGTFLFVPAVIGFVGCQLDSVVGATLERRGLVNKKTTNLIATCTGAILAYAALLVWFPTLMP